MQESGRTEDRLTLALRAVARADATLGSSPVVGARLRAEVRAIALARRRRKYVAIFAVAACLWLALSVAAWRVSSLRRAVTVSGSSAESDLSVPRAEVTTAFLPLIYSDVPITNRQIVRLEVPREALASFGLGVRDVVDAGRSGSIAADVLIDDDGLARAVRFVRRRAD